MTENTTKDESVCPVCGKANSCQAKTDPGHCWCVGSSVDYTKLRQQLGNNKQQCLCPNCLKAFELAASS